MHKTDVGGVVLGVDSLEKARREFDRLIAIEQATGVLFSRSCPAPNYSSRLAGTWLRDLIHAGLGGIAVEVFRDVAEAITPVGAMKPQNDRAPGASKLFAGHRGRAPLSADAFSRAIQRVSLLCEAAPKLRNSTLIRFGGRARSARRRRPHPHSFREPITSSTLHGPPL